MNILVTGGCGFIGSNLSISIKKQIKNSKVFAFDNFFRKGSLINKKRIKKNGVKVIKGDIRLKKDFYKLPDIDLIIDCAADPSVASGLNSGIKYLIDTNLIGTLNTLEFAKKNRAKLIFLSSSRVYPFEKINNLKFKVKNNTFIPSKNFKNSKTKLFSEKFTTNGIKTFYGFSKFSSENLIQEYAKAYNMSFIINRCGVVSGPWQWGRIDQGFVVYWMLSYLFKLKLNYIGYGGNGYQVRDILDVEDLSNLINSQIKNFSLFKNDIFNVGGGPERAMSLKNLTIECNKLFKLNKSITKISNTRYGDIPYYVTDNSKITELSGWKPKKKIKTTLRNIYNWVVENKSSIKKLI